MSSHNWPSVQNGQSQYPPFNPNTASYASDDTQAYTSGLADLAVTSSAPIYSFNPNHDINGTAGLTLDQYKAGQRASGAPSVPFATPVSNKRQLPHDQMMSSPSSQSGENSGNQTPPKKRARKGPKGNATPHTPRTRVFVLGESVFSPEDFTAGLEHFKKISTGQYSVDDDDLSRMRDFLTWGEDEQRKWLAKLSPEQFGVVLFAEKQDRDHQQSVATQPTNTQATQLQNHNAASSFGNQQHQGNGVQNEVQLVQHMMALNNLSNFNQQFSPLAQNANLQQMAVHNPQGQSVQFGTQIPSFIVGPNGQLLPQQQNMFGNMSTMPGYQSSNMQIPAAYRQQIMVNGQLMTVNLQPAFSGHQGGNFNSNQLMPGAFGFTPQQHGANVNHTFNSMGQQNSTDTYTLPSGGQPNNSNQGQNYVLPTLSHAARVAEAQLRAATMRRQHADLRARGLPVPTTPNHPKLPPLVMSGPGLGNIPEAVNSLPLAAPTHLVNAFEGIDWEKDPEKDAKASTPNNSLGGHTPTGNGFPMKFADVSGSNPVFLSQAGNAAMINHTGRATQQIENMVSSRTAGHHAVNRSVVPSYQVQLPNSAGQLSIGPNAQGSTLPAGAAKGTSTKASPKSKKTTKKPSAASSTTIANVANALFPTSISGPPTSQAVVGTALPNTSFSMVQNLGYSHGAQYNPISLDMPAPFSAITRSPVKLFASKLAFPPLPSPVSPTVANSFSSGVDASASQASAMIPAQSSQPGTSSLGFPERNMPMASTSSVVGTTTESSETLALEPADESSYLSTPAGTELTPADFDALFQPITTPELEPSALNEPPTPEDSQPTDFNDDSPDGFVDFLNTPGIAPSGEYVGVGVYDEAQPIGLGFNMTDGEFDPMTANMDFADMDFSDMFFDDWSDTDFAQ
ncbi:hypothetical protein V496_06009 [Pseudogymnoascus sp. VKM F-4515 (FW-2607)]|nr:hypothetical protein V496_06009 [Pseudogymnoascus sp. VKM F-4515 (FW-2607)]KFY91235.1 hypothetical protein V498_05555 [Pseudogymnoascus sp. VKM F-4517 (FW-2822)]